MADAKKPDKGGAKKPAAPSGSGNPLEGMFVFGLLVAIMVLFVIIPTVFSFFGGQGGPSSFAEFSSQVSSFFAHLLNVVSYISIFISLMLILGLVYAKSRYQEVSSEHHEMVHGSSALQGSTAVHAVTVPGPSHLHAAPPDPRWQDIERQMQSSNPSDWRIAILEADIMLDDMISQMGYAGDTMGDRMKQVDPKDFKTIQDAWRAHKIRNTIAHEGASYNLSRSEADAAIAMYKKVFDEFYFI